MAVAAPMMIAAAAQAIGSIYAGNAAAAQSQAQANTAAANANAVRLQTNAREEAVRRRNAMQLGELRAAASQTGFDASSGSLADLQSRSSAQLELDALTERYNGELQSISLDNEAQSLRSQARAQRNSGYLSAAGAALGAVGNYMGQPRIGGPAPIVNRDVPYTG